MRLLVVEDEKNLNKLITKKLMAEGYSVAVSYTHLDVYKRQAPNHWLFYNPAAQ